MDRYAKVILTVIATALTALAVENGFISARADDSINKVEICSADDPSNCAIISKEGGALRTYTD